MGLEYCSDCKRMHYLTDKCISRNGAKPKTPKSQGNVPDLEALLIRGMIDASNAKPIVGDVTKRPRGRPRIHPDRKAYKAEHERKRRSKAKEDKQNG